MVWAVRGWVYRKAAERSLPAPIQWEVDMVVDVRRAREVVPRWQRIGFAVLLGVLLAALLDPGYVFWAMVGLVLTAIGWPLLRWRSRIPAVAASVAWAVYMIGWQHTVPLVGLTLFGRWYCSRTAAEWADYQQQAHAQGWWSARSTAWDEQAQDEDEARDEDGGERWDGPWPQPQDEDGDGGWVVGIGAHGGTAAPTVPLPPVVPTGPVAAAGRAGSRRWTPRQRQDLRGNVLVRDTDAFPAVPAGPEQRARVADLVARWPQIAVAAGMADTTLGDVRFTPWGWEATWRLRPGQTWKHAVQAKLALESALGVRPDAVRVDKDLQLARQVHLRVVERDPLATPVPRPAPSMGSILRPLLVGVYEDATSATLPLFEQHALIVAANGAGKTVLLRTLVEEALAAIDVEVWGIDLKRGAGLAPYTDCLGQLATTPEQALRLLQAAVAVLETRAEQRRGDHWPASRTHPVLWIVVDEHAELVRTCPAAVKLEESIANRGRSVGVSLIVTALRATQEALGSDELRQQLRTRICLSLEDPGDADLLFGRNAAKQGWDPELLDAPGKFFVRSRSRGLTKPRLARGFAEDPAITRAVAARYGRPVGPDGTRPSRLEVEAVAAAAAVLAGQAPSSSSVPSSSPDAFPSWSSAAAGTGGAPSSPSAPSPSRSWSPVAARTGTPPSPSSASGPVPGSVPGSVPGAPDTVGPAPGRPARHRAHRRQGRRARPADWAVRPGGPHPSDRSGGRRAGRAGRARPLVHCPAPPGPWSGRLMPTSGRPPATAPCGRASHAPVARACKRLRTTRACRRACVAHRRTTRLDAPPRHPIGVAVDHPPCPRHLDQQRSHS